MSRASLVRLLCVVSLAGACSAQPGLTADGTPVAQSVGVNRGEIVGGTNDTADPAVVVLFGQKPGSNQGSLCTAEVISPHVALTAAHCVSPQVVGSGVAFQLFLGTDINDQAQLKQSNFVDVKATHFDPAFNTNDLQGGHDIAVVVTATTIPVTPIPVNQDPVDDTDVGQTLRVVGYGVTSMNNPTDTSGTKRQVSMPLEAVDNLFLQFGNATHNTCEGDSGGPAFLTRKGVEVIVGVTSFGDQNCMIGGADTRVDTYWSSFIAPAIIAADGKLPDGTTPTITSDAGSSSGTDGGSSGGGSDAGMNLAIGQVCTDSTQCTSGICTLGSSRYCTASCDPKLTDSCPVGTHCGQISGSPYCIVTTHGCSAATGTATSGSGPAGGALLLLACAALLLRRRAHARIGR